MEATAARTPEQALQWMDALSDPTRLRLLRLLERHELGVAELCEVLQLPQSTVSRHLKVLSEQDWVKCRAQGTANLYRMVTSEQEPSARKLWAWTREQTDGWATVQQDRLRLERQLAGREPQAQAFFAGAASRWDKLRSELYGDTFSQTALLALLPATWTVADLGCGTGPLAASIAPHVARVIGVDQSAAMLKAAGRRTAALANVDLRRGSLESLPIEDASCDGALLVLALTYVPDPRAAVLEMARILKPGGRGVVLDLLRHDRDDFREEMGQQHPGFTERDLGSWLEEAGVHAVAVRALAPEPAAKGPALVLATGTR